jgi:hypothetical protein
MYRSFKSAIRRAGSRKISPGVYPEPAEGVEMTRPVALRCSRLGAVNFTDMVPLDIENVGIPDARQ